MFSYFHFTMFKGIAEFRDSPNARYNNPSQRNGYELNIRS